MLGGKTVKKYNKIAKNLLENKTCQNCLNRIDNNCKLKPILANKNNFPKELTCLKWKLLSEIEMTLQSKSFTIKPEKLKNKMV